MKFRDLISAEAATVSCLGNNLVNSANAESGTSLWLWSPLSILSKSKTITATDIQNVKDLLTFCLQKGVTEIYLQINRVLEVEKYQYLVASLNAASISGTRSAGGIKVHALDGSENWFVTEGKVAKQAFFDWVFAYQAVSTPNQQFAGIHLDVEPYSSEVWRTTSPHLQAVTDYLKFIHDAIKRTEAARSCSAQALPMLVA